MKTHPARNNLATKSEFRDRITAAIFNSPSGRRVLEKCLEDLDKPVNSDEESRRLVLARYANELDILRYELEELLVRYSGSKQP
jgi:hypothetical protein